MDLALIFPGQGSQDVGMGAELAKAFPAAKRVFEQVDSALGQKLSQIMWEGPQETLTLTENAQPALMAHSLAVLRVEVAGTETALPLDAVERTLQVAEGELARTGDRRALLLDTGAVPFVPLARALGATAETAERTRPYTVVLVRSGALEVALGVDRLLGTADRVIRAIPPTAGHVPLVAGASLDAHGDPELLLDPAGLVE